jgi:hypothetical protein
VGGPGGVWVLYKRAPKTLCIHHGVYVLVAGKLSPREFLPLQLCILLINRPTPNIHNNSHYSSIRAIGSRITTFANILFKEIIRNASAHLHRY